LPAPRRAIEPLAAVQFDQLLRRLAWRTRRRLRPGADNDPLVSLENGAPATRGSGASIWLIGLGLLFIATSALLALQNP